MLLLVSSKRSWIAIALVSFALGAPATAGVAHAQTSDSNAPPEEPILLTAEGLFVAPLTSPQVDWFQPGGSLGVAVQTPFMGWLVPNFRARGLLLGDGSAPADAGLIDPGVGSVLSLSVGLRARPLHRPDEVERGTSLWIEIDAGGTLTGGSLVRPIFEAAAGYTFAVDELGVGPLLRFVHVLHFDDPLESNSAYLLSAGLEVTFFDRRARQELLELDEEPTPQSEPEPPCELGAEDIDGFEDDDNCLDADNDADGVADVDDQCPMQPEDFDGWRDEDGCPEPDNDLDNFTDDVDECPNDAEVINGVDDEDGCPDRGLITMVNDRIVLDERVLFDFERAHVHTSARPVLDAIIELWRQHRNEWTLVRVEGHSDTRGGDDFNQELSERRATSVRSALVRLGMPETLVQAVGHGATAPMDRRDTEEAHQMNRRVEFIIVSRRAVQHGEGAASSASAGPGSAESESGSAGSESGSAESESDSHDGALVSRPNDEVVR